MAKASTDGDALKLSGRGPRVRPCVDCTDALSARYCSRGLRGQRCSRCAPGAFCAEGGSMTTVEMVKAATAAIEESTQLLEELLCELRGEIKAERPDLRLVAEEASDDA